MRGAGWGGRCSEDRCDQGGWFVRTVLTALIFAAGIFQHSAPRAAIAGDLAPYGAPDQVLNAADVLVLQRMVLGDIIPTQSELLAGDVAPLNNPDNVLNAGDLVVLLRAVQGLVTLPPLIIPPDAPVLNAVSSPTNSNPYTLTGTATPSIEVRLYVNGVQQAVTTANSVDGSFSFDAILIDGFNDVYATAWDGVSESAPSLNETIDYQNSISRSQDSATISGTVVWTPGVVPTPYSVTGALTIGPGSTLILQPGTVLEFGINAQVTVNGTLIVQGAAGNEVVFTSSQDIPVSGDWAGIRVTNTASNIVIDGAVVEYAANGIYFDDSALVGLVTNTIIRNNSTGIYMNRSASPVIGPGNEITANQYGMRLIGKNFFGVAIPLPVINGNRIYANTDTYDPNIFTSNYANGNNVKIDATGNYWGSTQPGVIAGTIYDYSDSASSNNPNVDYGGYLDNSGQVAVGETLVGVINADRILVPGTTYEVLGNLAIASGVTLTIPEGVTLKFSHFDWRLNVEGSLVVNGTQANPVVFTSGLSNPAIGDWQGIRVTSTAMNVMIDWAVIEYAGFGVEFDSSGSVGTVMNTVFRDNSRAVWLNRNASPVIGPGNDFARHFNTIVLVGDGTAGNNPMPLINGNRFSEDLASAIPFSIVHITAVNYYDGNSVRIDATGNYWGSIKPEEILVTISGASGGSGEPVVDFGGYLDIAGQLAVGNTLVGVLGTTTLTSGSTYEVLGDIYVKSGDTLTIPEGVTLVFSKETLIN